MRIVCSNKWCKSMFDTTSDYQESFCPRCKSMDKDLSGGITWQEKKYEGQRFDGKFHQMDIKVNRYFK